MVESFDRRPSSTSSHSLHRRRRSSRRRSMRRRPSFPFPLNLLLLWAVVFVAAMEEARMFDRNLQHFSPEGRLYQVQYAERAAQRGSPVLALSNGRDALALCCERRRASRLEDFAALEKLGEVQPPPPPVPVPGDHTGGGAGACAYLGFAGLAADGRRLLDRTRLFAENYRLCHGEDPGVRALALFIADTQHRNTFVRAHRPYGVACVLAGFDDEAPPPPTFHTHPDTDASPPPLRPRIFATGPAGTLQEHRAVCVGENSAPVAARLEAHLRDIGRMSGRELARFGARLLLDARGGVGGGGDGGEKKEDGGKGGGGGEEPGFEVEVLVVRRRGAVGGLQARRVMLAGREDLGRVLGEEGDGSDEDGWFESS